MPLAGIVVVDGKLTVGFTGLVAQPDNKPIVKEQQTKIIAESLAPLQLTFSEKLVANSGTSASSLLHTMAVVGALGITFMERGTGIEPATFSLGS